MVDASHTVLVIGAGPVGQTTALLLARWGISSIVVDARARREPSGSKAICQQRDVLDVWESVGAGARIAAEGTTWSRARTFYRDVELFSVAYSDRGRSPFPAWVNVSQTRTEEILDERIAQRPSIHVRWSHRAVRLEETTHGVLLTCETPSGEVVLEGAYAVACTGARDRTIHRELGVEMIGRTFADQFVICDLRADMPGWELERRFYFDPPWNPGRQVLIHTCPDRTFRIDWQVPADFDFESETRDGRHDARIRRIVGDRPYELLWQSVYRFHSRHATRMQKGRVLFAGDAAHVFSPFGARGLNSGVQDAENAAWKLAFVLHGWAPDALIESYHQERLAAALENLEVTEKTMRFLVPQTEAEHARRLQILERARTDASARAEVDSGRLAEPYWYVDSRLTTPDPTRLFAGRPPAGESPPPAPGVLVPDLPIRHAAARLRGIVRDGVLALTADDVDAVHVAATLRAATRAPSHAHRIGDLDVDGALALAFDVRAGEVWLIRPDGHVAAVLSRADATTLAAATARMLGGAR
jgi:3-(3-hydroxy-phenyl)propionate hydroxylase